MKRILFISVDMGSGGSQRSLASLLNAIDYKQYKVDLALLVRDGLFLNLIPKDVKIIDVGYGYYPVRASMTHYIKEGDVGSAVRRFAFSLCKKLHLGERNEWKVIEKLLPNIDTEYDAVIAYGDGLIVPFAMDKIKNAKKRILWNHIDYANYNLDASFDKPYYERADYIVTISESCKSVLNRFFPEYACKTIVIENIISERMINKLAEENVDFDNDFKGTRLITIGRLTEQKGYDLAVPAMARVLKNNPNVKWYVIGVGQEEKKIQSMIAEEGISNNFILLGERSNPYAYLRRSDIYVQTSRYEGKPIAIEEAKMLAMPIIVTNYPTVSDSINNEMNGIVVQMNPDCIAEGIVKLVDNRDLREKLNHELIKSRHGNENAVIEQFNSMIM